MNSEDFTGPGARYTLLGDRQMRGSLFPTVPEPSGDIREQRQRASRKHKAKRHAEKIALQIAKIEATV